MPNRQKGDGQPERSKLKEKREPRVPHQMEIHNCAVTVAIPSTREAEQESSVCSKKKHAGWWLSHTPFTDRVMEADCFVPLGRHDETLVENDVRRKEEFSLGTDQVKPSKELRWARLFGFGISSHVAVEKAEQSMKQTQRIRSVPRRNFKLKLMSCA